MVPAPDIPVPLIVPLWPGCDVPVLLPAALPDVPAPVPVVDPLPLVVPEVEPAPVVPAPVLPELVLPAPVLEPLPDMEDPEPLLVEAFVSIQLLPEPARQPVTVTVFPVELLALVEPV